MPGIRQGANGDIVAIGAGCISRVCEEVNGSRAAVLVRLGAGDGAGAVDQGRALRGAVIGTHGCAGGLGRGMNCSRSCCDFSLFGCIPLGLRQMYSMASLFAMRLCAVVQPANGSRDNNESLSEEEEEEG